MIALLVMSFGIAEDEADKLYEIINSDFPEDEYGSFKFGYFLLVKNPKYVYSTRNDKDLDYSDSFVLEHDYHVECIVYYDGFSAWVESYPKVYKKNLTENECMAEIISIAGGGFGTNKNPFTAYSLDNNGYAIISEDQVGDAVINHVSFYIVHKNGIIKIDSNHTCKNDAEWNSFIDFVFDLANDVIPLAKMES